MALQGSPATSPGELFWHNTELSISLSTGRSDCCKHLEKELQSYKSEVNSLQFALSACKEEIKLLQHQMSSEESTFLEEISQKDAQISYLGAELDHKTQLVAHLTKQLHQMKIEFTQVLEASSVTQSVAIPTTSDYDCSLAQREHPTTGQIRRRVRRATASALPHDPDKKSSEKAMARRSLPTPVHTPSSVSPRPPSTSPPQRLLHRASRVTHRDPQPASTPQDASLTPQSTTSLDPVQLHKRAPNDLLKQEGNLTANVCVLARSSPPVLPPIPTNSNFVAHQNSEASSFPSCRIPESHRQCPLHPTQHRHVILARSQGLNSAPSSVRVLARRRTRNLGQNHCEGCEGDSVKEGEVESGENRSKAEGILLVKEEPRHQKSQAWQELHQSGSD